MPKSGIRDIPISKQCRTALMKQKVQQRIVLGREAAKPLPGLEDVLFVTKHGTPMNVQNMKDSIKRIVDEINLMRDCDYSEQMEYFGGHTFRHTFATRSIEAGVPAVVLQRWLGHTNIHITLDRYTDVFERMNRTSIERYDGYIDRIKEEFFEYTA